MFNDTSSIRNALFSFGFFLTLLGGARCAAEKDQNALEMHLARAVEEAAFVSEGPDEVISTKYLRAHHPPYLGQGTHTKWFLGEYSYRSGANISVPSRGQHISGTDLGSSVHLRGRDFFYLGDTFWPGRVECARRPFKKHMLAAGCAPNACCNDAIVVSDDRDPTDGTDVGIPLVHSKARSAVYKPLVIPGIHDNPNFLNGFWRRNLDPNYTAPGGAGVVQGLTNHPGPRVLLWYSTAIWPQGRISRERYPYRAPRSYVVLSENGYDFESLIKNARGEPVPFSMDREGAPAKFLCTSPVEISAPQLAAGCDAGSAEKRLLCRLPSEYRSQGGILVFGSGRNYRLSPLYLAYLSHAHLAREDGFHTLFARRDAGGGWRWSPKESAATPIIGGEYLEQQLFREACLEKTDFWGCVAVVKDLAGSGHVDQPTDLFGEISVKLILDGPRGMEPTLVMLSNHQRSSSSQRSIAARENADHLKAYLRDVFVHVRTTSLYSPELWESPPAATGARGYGPYIIDRHTHYEPARAELVLWHVLSLWRGPPMSDFKRHSQYGMATNQVRIPWPVRQPGMTGGGR